MQCKDPRWVSVHCYQNPKLYVHRFLVASWCNLHAPETKYMRMAARRWRIRSCLFLSNFFGMQQDRILKNVQVDGFQCYQLCIPILWPNSLRGGTFVVYVTFSWQLLEENWLDFWKRGKGLVILMEAFEGGVGGGKSVSNSMAASVAACCI